eukprot:GFKZ01006330.1.p1 GENE.GFKZ01006330.1~~GFKZ01006330.1.p1  ORF type:complete len:671 (+),score=67.77 GFKZ01006330.1:670-2682(+)
MSLFHALAKRRKSALSRLHRTNTPTTPIPPLLPSQWRPGAPCHWLERTAAHTNRYLLIRLIAVLQLFAGLAYLHYRITETVAVFNHTLLYRAYQFAFFCLEVVSFVSIALRVVECWMTTKRNCVDFKRIPFEMLAPRGVASPDLYGGRYPSVALFVPCYNEDVALVHDTVVAALAIDYPTDMLSVYLCDDGQDPSKRSMIAHLQHKYANLHYVTRPHHSNAKAGNLNYSLERTDCDLVVILDADFIARPNLLQRLVPYYYVWNPVTGLYEFDETLAAVQAPQQFRNLSPFDSDMTDQRATFFMEVVLPGKDWFNAAPLIGTTNLLNRRALQEANFFPHHSVTEDTALSIVLHALGFQTYYVNEPLASGLATTSLWSNFDQRERWLQGDWQILFSSKGPLTMAGLSLVQRIMYLNMSWNRLISIVHLLYDLASVLLLVFGLTMVDVPNTQRFIQFLAPYILLGFLSRYVRTFGKDGYAKSENGAVAFEVMFRFVTLKGLFKALFQSKKIKFKVTDKTVVPDKSASKLPELWERDWLKNLKRAWFNVTMMFLLSFAIGYCLARPPCYHSEESSRTVLPITLAVGFAAANLIPHLLAVYLCFTPLVSGWVMQDLVHGRCDQYAVDPVTGKRYVPPSAISLVNVLQLFLIFGSMATLSLLTLQVNDNFGSFVPI